MKFSLKVVAANFLVAIAYIAMARLGLLLALMPGYATAFWPPSGIAVAALLFRGPILLPGIFLGSLIANLLTATHSFGTTLFVSTMISIASTLQPFALYYLLKTYTNSMTYLLNTRTNVLYFLFFTIICCFISATIGILTLYWMGLIHFQSIIPNWITWWLGDITGILVFTPFLFAWSRFSSVKECSPRFFEGCLLLGVTFLVLIFTYGGWKTEPHPFEYALMPCILWAVFRFGSVGATSLLVLISAFAVIGTTHGYGHLMPSSLNTALLLLQTFIGVLTATTLILISVVNEVKHANKVLEEYNEELKMKQKALEDSLRK